MALAEPISEPADAQHETGGTLTIDLAAIEANWRALARQVLTVECGAVVKAALDACETYYQAFQFVLWANRAPREAIAFATFETRGTA